MSENDYIAEYVKTHYPNILGVDFAFWKFIKKFKNFANSLGDIFNNIPKDDLKLLTEEENYGEDGQE